MFSLGMKGVKPEDANKVKSHSPSPPVKFPGLFY